MGRPAARPGGAVCGGAATRGRHGVPGVPGGWGCTGYGSRGLDVPGWGECAGSSRVPPRSIGGGPPRRSPARREPNPLRHRGLRRPAGPGGGEPRTSDVRFRPLVSSLSVRGDNQRRAIGSLPAREGEPSCVGYPEVLYAGPRTTRVPGGPERTIDSSTPGAAMTTRATALCSVSEELRTKMLEAVNGRRLVTVHERLDEPIPATAECVVLALDGSESRLGREASLRQAVVRRCPVIVVSDAPLPEWFRRRLGPAARIPVREVERELFPLIIHAICSTEYERMRHEVRMAPTPPPLLCRAIDLALRACETKPYKRPRDLAGALGVSLTALDDAFRSAAGGKFTPSDLLSALQLVRALELRSRHSWTASARAIGFSRRSLSRKAQAWLGCTLRELDAWNAPALLAQFDREYLSPMLGAA